MNERIAVLGCGLMGSKLARTFADNGADVIVWNRTEAKARELEGPNISVAGSVADAAARAELVIVSLDDPRGPKSVTDLMLAAEIERELAKLPKPAAAPKGA